jgi:NAD(P)-dependent dehydrogenase (short-subunit alcohol dehydrogenase family)
MNQVVVVTGGSSNIGWSCVRRFSPAARIVIGDVRPPAEPLPDGIRYVATDITDPQACHRLMETASSLGKLHALVHSAAVTADARPIADIPVDEWRRLIDVNLTGAFLVAQAAIPALCRDAGSLVMIGSRAARVGYAALSASPSGTKAHYCASKAGVLSLVRSLAVELAVHGVRVNAVVPGSIEGTMIPRQRWPELAARIPAGRLGTPDEVADAAWFLCSDGARYITGHALDVNGGTWMN